MVEEWLSDAGYSGQEKLRFQVQQERVMIEACAPTPAGGAAARTYGIAITTP